jgi:ABC-type sugar transport system ATPase subunit
MTVLPVEVRGVEKRFGAVAALKGVDLTAKAGECVALLGENGAGKSTLVKILAGVQRPDAGTITFGGRPVTLDSPRTARELGVCLCHQELPFLPKLTVEENIFLGRERTKLGVIRDHGERAIVAQTLVDLGLDVDLRSPMDRLSVAERQLVEIARGLAQEAELVMLDEPTSALTPQEAERLFEVVRMLVARGTCVVYISHRLDEIADLADRVVVLRDGANAGELPPTASSREVVALMVGREIEDFYPAIPHVAGEVVLRIEELRTEGLDAVTLDVRAGEIVGIGGLVGSGYSELAHVLSGKLAPSGGRITIAGKSFARLHMADALRAGMAIVPEDRRRDGLNMTASILENVTLPALDRAKRFGVLSSKKLNELASDVLSGLRVRAHSFKQPVGQLSGGNQQKVLLGKALISQPRILVLVEPTRGIDVGVKVEVYELLGRLAAAGTTVIMISSDLNEIRNLADRLVIFYRGRVQGFLEKDEATPEAVGLLATGQALVEAA